SFAPRTQRLASRKLWIAFARAAEGRVVVDTGARRALVERGKSLLLAGVRAVDGAFDVDAAVEVVDEDGAMFAKGLSRYSSALLETYRGPTTPALPDGLPAELIHRDALVVPP